MRRRSLHDHFSLTVCGCTRFRTAESRVFALNSFILVTPRYKLETEQMKHISEIQLKDFLFEYSLYQEVQISDADNLDFLDSSEDIDY